MKKREKIKQDLKREEERIKDEPRFKEKRKNKTKKQGNKKKLAHPVYLRLRAAAAPSQPCKMVSRLVTLRPAPNRGSLAKITE